MSIVYTIDEQTIRLSDMSGDLLTIREEPGEAGVLVFLAGTLRNDVIFYLQDELESLLSLGLSITVDFSEVRYVSAAAQQVFLSAQHRIERTGKGKQRFIHMPEDVYLAFERTGASELLNIERGGNHAL